jgi:hypothetical protein
MQNNDFRDSKFFNNTNNLKIELIQYFDFRYFGYRYEI